jgi:flagellin
MISFQTNYASMVGEQNMNTNQTFQTKTIESLTSGYRINSSGDDAAGLAVANGYRNEVAELTQGVINANSGVSDLQIMDGGLNNISTILDRLQTLATESASSTFTGDRTTLNNEYQSLLTEINRQAANIGLNTGGVNATNLSVYIGGGNNQGNSEVSVDLTAGIVDTTGLGLNNTNLLGGGTSFSAGPDLRSSGNILVGVGDTETISVNLAGSATPIAATITSTTSQGLTVQQAIDQLNDTLSGYGITASINQATGTLMLSGNSAFTAVESNNGTAGLVSTGATITDNATQYAVDGNGPAPFVAANADGEVLNFVNASGDTKTVTLSSAVDSSLGATVTDLNNQLSSVGISAVINAAGTGINFESTAGFNVTKSASNASAGVFAASTAVSDNAALGTSSGSATENSLLAVNAVQAAVASLGLTQGKVGAGENTLQYAINLANSQITNISSAESQLRDADVAQEAANLSKSQVLEQASVAAMAQANSSPQYVLKLLQ